MTAATAAPDQAPRQQLRLGIALALLCAFSSSTMPSLARLAYEGGADAMTVTVFRAGAALALYFALCVQRGQPPIPPRRWRLPAAGAGIVWLVAIYCYVRSIQHIPVGIAVSLFFLFPLIVAVIARVVDRESLSHRRIISLALGFAGVSLAVGVSLAGIDPVGIVLALSAALGLSINIMISVRLMRHANPLTAMTAMIGAASVALAVAAPVAGVPLPTTAPGWFGLLLGTAMFCVANSLFYVAINLIGSVRTAMACNIEPVAATLVAFVVLGEALSPIQMAGVILVVAAIYLMQSDAKPPRQPDAAPAA